MNLTKQQIDRAAGVLVGGAVGDALGAGYEFTFPEPDLEPIMKGGGLGNFAPGEWTDDTSQAVVIAQVAAQGLDLRDKKAQTKLVEGWQRWFQAGPPDVGIQTAQILRTGKMTGSQLAHVAKKYHEAQGESAGNGSLMRTGAVALAYLDDPEALVEAAMSVSALTHYQDLAQEACALWCLMIRHTVLEGEYPNWADVLQYMPQAEWWEATLEEAELELPGRFFDNTWAIGALQAAWSSITHSDDFTSSLTTVIRIGRDTDTVAAITGALAGARAGASRIPADWVEITHGWPGLTADDLYDYALEIIGEL